MPPVATSLETGELSFGREGVRGYAAWPRGAHPLPGLVLVPDVRGLSEHYRDVVACRYLLDLSEAETAQVLGIARGTVKSRLSRALDRLERQLDPEVHHA